MNGEQSEADKMGKHKTQRTDEQRSAAKHYAIDDTIETLLVNAEPGAGDKQLKDYYDKHREGGLGKVEDPQGGGAC